MKTRYIVGGIIQNEKSEILLCKMSNSHGVYPGQWGLVGGGVEKDELIEDALQREILEEVGLQVLTAKPYWFHDEVRNKKYKDGTSESIYMVYLLFDVEAKGEVSLNDEWDEFEWVTVQNVKDFDLNDATRKTFEHKGWI